MTTDYEILIIDDNPARCHDLSVVLEFLGEPAVTSTVCDWKERVGNPSRYLAIIVGEDNLATLKDLLADIAAWAVNIPILLSQQNQDTSYLPLELSHLIVGTIEQPLRYAQILDYLHRCQIRLENTQTQQPKPRRGRLFRSLVGSSTVIQQVRKMVDQVAPSDATVLVLGASGTGKEVVARNIHCQSERRDKPFVPVNCGAIPGDLLESELFGHEKGAFTGAITTRQGRFEMAQDGTLFLDEIGDMPLQMQVKLLRVLQERCFERIGSNKSIQCNVRIIAATHHDLELSIRDGQFREDLFYRLNVFPIELPSLNERIEDIPLLLNELMARLDSEGQGSIKFLPRAIDALCGYNWPGNVRELANLVERLSILYPNSVVDIGDLPKKFHSNDLSLNNVTTAPVEDKQNDVKPDADIMKTLNLENKNGIDLKQHLIETELSLIKHALAESGGVVSRAAEFLNLRRTTLVEKMRKYGMQRS